MDKVPPSGFLLIGVLAGIGANYLWEIFRLPGYGIKITDLPASSHPNALGLDDVLLMLVGFLIMIAGRKDRKTMMFGLGWIIGVVLTKFFEFADTNATGLITPGSFALPIL